MNENKEEKTLRSIIREDLEVTSAVGIPHMVRAENLGLKIMWYISYLIGMGFTVYLITQNIIDYYGYDVTTKSRILNARTMDFPRVTICNFDPFITNSSITFLANVIKTDPDYADYNVSLSDLELVNDYILYEADFQPKALFAAKNADSTIKAAFGYDYSTFIFSCSYGGSFCKNRTDFEYLSIYDYQFGNCVSINVNKTKPIMKSKTAGQKYGLQLEMLVGKADFYDSFNKGTGIKVFIHNQTTYYSDGEAIDVSVGTETNIELTRVYSENLKDPYSDCKIDSNTTPKDVNSEYYSAFIKQNMTYRNIDCSGLCYQNNLLKNCKCIDPFENYFDIFGNATVSRFCYFGSDEENTPDYKCYLNLTTAGDLDGVCSDLCPKECSKISFQSTTSFSQYPSNSYEGNLLDKYSVLNSFSKSLTEKILKLNIYYQDMSYQSVTESPAITLVGLISNIGGTLGLFLGIAILTLVEFVDMFIKMLIHMCKKKKPQETESPVRFIRPRKLEPIENTLPKAYDMYSDRI